MTESNPATSHSRAQSGLPLCRLILVAELDGIFLAGQADDREFLYRWLARRRSDVGLVLVTRRALASASLLLGDPAIPSPHYVIADAGSTIASGVTFERIRPLEGHLRRGWPGAEAIRRRMRDIDGTREQAIPQSGRVSYVLDRPATRTTARAERIARDLGVRIQSSAGVYLDFLPPHAGEGAALRILLEYTGAEVEQTLVAGHAAPDESLYLHGARGVVASSAEAALIEATSGKASVYEARAAGIGAVREALEHFFGKHVFCVAWYQSPS
jgi:hydroxymethylpyrimidine pyrophosphatase-like HAD family hydrolase